MPAPPDPVTPALSAEFNAAVRLFPERLKSPWWIGHIPFAYELIARHRPRTIVELGTYSGSSFAAFCQALQAVGQGGHCFGIDLWQGDVHMGGFDESLYLEMSEFARTRYPDTARLIRKHFDMRPAAIIRDLNLRRPIYRPTAAYGHFGRNDIDAPWEKTDKAETLRRQAGL